MQLSICKSILFVGLFTIFSNAQIGTNWTEYFPEWTYHVPPNADAYGERYTYEGGVFHLWVLDTDLSSFPGQDSGPRSEVRTKNEYTTGSTQFVAEFKVGAGADKVGIWQVFQRPYPWMVRVYGERLYQYGNGSSFADTPRDWVQLNIIHHSATRELLIYLDNQLVLNTTISASDGSVDWYNKFGVYGRDGMGAINEIWFRNVQYFHSDNPGEPTDPIDPQDSLTLPEPIDTVYSIPVHIEAESFQDAFGIYTEETTDDTGDLNVGWINTGDWLEYQIDVPESGAYDVSFRVATTKDLSQIVLSSEGSAIDTFDVPNTGGWQLWQTASLTLNLQAGQQTLRLSFSGGSGGLLNLNWLEITKATQQPSAVQLSYPTMQTKATSVLYDIRGRILNNQDHTVYPHPTFK
jgi:hypothetical protein